MGGLWGGPPILALASGADDSGRKNVKNVLKRFIARVVLDEDGQDLIEYALLSAFIGLAGALAFPLVAAAMNTTYGNWDAGINGLWEPPNPM